MINTKNKIENAIIQIDKNEIKSFTVQLNELFKTNEKEVKLFKLDPNNYLENRGLNIDVRRELLQDSNFKSYAKVNWCLLTCTCTNCCITAINITNS